MRQWLAPISCEPTNKSCSHPFHHGLQCNLITLPFMLVQHEPNTTILSEYSGVILYHCLPMSTCRANTRTVRPATISSIKPSAVTSEDQQRQLHSQGCMKFLIPLIPSPIFNWLWLGGRASSAFLLISIPSGVL